MIAVHISDGVLLTTWQLVGYAVAAGFVSWSLIGLLDDEIPRTALFTAAFFVASLIHVPVGVGKVHLLLNGLVGVTLGRRAATAIAVGLTLQAVLVSHGGIGVLGVNIGVMAVPAYAAALLYRYSLIRSEFVTGCVIGFVTVMLTATLNYVTLKYGALPEVRSVSALIWLAHLPVAVVEALILGFTLEAVRAARPEWLTRAWVPAASVPPAELPIDPTPR